MPTDPERLYSPKEIAVLLKVHYQTVLQWCQTGKIRASRVGRAWRISENEYERISKEGLWKGPDDPEECKEV